MNRLSAVGPADLIRLRNEFATLDGDVAALAWSARRPRKPPEGELVGMGSIVAERGRAGGGRTKVPENLPPRPDVTPGQRRLVFPRVEEAQWVGTQNPPVRPKPSPKPLDEALLGEGPSLPDALFQPLAPWSRLGIPLRARIGEARPGRRLDVRRLVRDWSTMRPLVKVPFRKALRWPARLGVVWDDGPEMDPFARDMGYVVRMLGAVCDRGGLLEIPLIHFDAAAELRTVGLPLLVLSGRGQLVRTALPGAKAPGLADGFWRSDRGRRLLANPLATFLDPCPGHRRDGGMSQGAHLVSWTRGAACAPREARQREKEADRLLDLVSPVRRITPTILRWARRHLGRPADAGTEWDAWFFAEMHPAWDCTEFADIADQRRRREAFSMHPPNERFARQMDPLLGDCSPLIQLESRLTVAWARGAGAGLPMDCVELCTAAVQRLRELAGSGDQRAARKAGLGGWIRSLTESLPVALRAAPELRSVLASGCALGAWLEGSPKVVWPEGIDTEAARAELESLAIARPMTWRISQSGAGIELMPSPTGLEPIEGGMDLGRIRSERPLIHLESTQGGLIQRTTLPLPESGRVKLGAWSPGLVLRTDQQVLKLEGFRRPSWASHLEQDRFGLRAEFVVGGVVFAMRWIPPGTFWMGSPEDEPGRYSREGPRHRVTITHGFWIGETPVTQDQWRAVVETRGKETPLNVLNPKPSHFKGLGTLPVESVSWEDCVSFSALLNFELAAGEPEPMGFRLPTEAEWEYACRAGTETALPTGGITLRGENHAPELDDIAWYGGNCGEDLDVSNPYISASDWEQRQYPGPNAGTHRVGLKAPNRWGLHDMIGNVWEWCSDGQRDYAKGEIEDPSGPVGSRRVIRGGAWGDSARGCRSACRNDSAPGDRWDDLGFRLVLAPRSVS